MAATETSSAPQFPYLRLRQDDEFGPDVGDTVIVKSRSWLRLRLRLKGVPIRRRLRVKVSSLRRFLRKKVKLVSFVRISLARALKQLKESQAHLGDLFTGNYLFMQVNPVSIKSLHKAHHSDF